MAGTIFWDTLYISTEEHDSQTSEKSFKKVRRGYKKYKEVMKIVNVHSSAMMKSKAFLSKCRKIKKNQQIRKFGEASWFRRYIHSINHTFYCFGRFNQLFI